MSKYLVYQGYNEQWRWRKVNSDGKFLEQSELFSSKDEAWDAVLQRDPDAEIEDREAKLQELNRKLEEERSKK